MLANRFEICKHLGSGATAEVMLVKDITNGQFMAAKIMKIDNCDDLPETALAEAIVGQKLNHPFILKNLGFGKGLLDYGNENAPE